MANAPSIYIDLGEFWRPGELWCCAKKARSKAEKTSVQSEKALTAAERAVAAKLAERERGASGCKSSLARQRTPTWFAKFAWFITSENYLCVAARDEQQASKLLFELARPRDALVCCNSVDAPPCVVRAKKNSNGEWRVSPLALHEAGSFAACRSRGLGLTRRAPFQVSKGSVGLLDLLLRVFLVKSPTGDVFPQVQNQIHILETSRSFASRRSRNAHRGAVYAHFWAIAGPRLGSNTTARPPGGYQPVTWRDRRR